ncbi:MAG: CBS domain-containing protein [Myxococcota bacterium]
MTESATNVRVRAHMTAVPSTIAPWASVGDALKRFESASFRHLPVVDGDGRLRGMVSRAGLSAADAADGRARSVADVMDEGPFVAAPEDDLGALLERMDAAHADAAVIVEEDAVVGVLTSTDVARLAAMRLGRGRPEFLPSEIRKRILRAHGELRTHLARVDQLVSWLRDGHPESAATLKSWARELNLLLKAHMAEEEQMLLPALVDADGFGPVRAAALREEHALQQRSLTRVMTEIDAEASPEGLADRVSRFVEDVRRDMDEEERLYVSSKLLKDDLMPADYFGG